MVDIMSSGSSMSAACVTCTASLTNGCTALPKKSSTTTVYIQKFLEWMPSRSKL